MAYPSLTKIVKSIIKPQPFRYLGWFLRSLGAIPSSKINEHGKGAVSRIVEEISKHKKFLLLLSPKGTIVKREWRTGYRWIAEGLECDICVIGADFITKRIEISKVFHNDSELDVDELKREMGKFIPLFPEEEVVPLRAHDPRRISAIDWFKFIYHVVGMVVVFYAWNDIILCIENYHHPNNM